MTIICETGMAGGLTGWDFCIPDSAEGCAALDEGRRTTGPCEYVRNGDAIGLTLMLPGHSGGV